MRLTQKVSLFMFSKIYFAELIFIYNFASTKLSNMFVGHHCLTLMSIEKGQSDSAKG